MTGIYKITNQINNKVYIGQSVNIKKRFNQHKCAARDGENSYFYQALRKYGVENFSFEVLEECPKEKLNEREIYWIEYFHSTDRSKGYNISRGGDGFTLYDYKEIYNLWKSGLSCKEIENKLHCTDSTVTQALRAYNLSEKVIKSRVQKKIAIVALDKKTGVPLKSFESIAAAKRALLLDNYTGASISFALKESSRTAYGYKWAILNASNKPEVEMSDEEFLKGKVVCHGKSSYPAPYKVKRPSREELKTLIRKKSFVQIGKDYGVTDNAIRKWCKAYNLPYLKRDINSYTDEQWKKI